jgi:hypothetical protein
MYSLSPPPAARLLFWRWPGATPPKDHSLASYVYVRSTITAIFITTTMWFFASPRNPYRETVEAKRKRRADALKHAPAYTAGVHQKYLEATGIC